MRGISLLAENRLGSQEGLCSMEEVYGAMYVFKAHNNVPKSLYFIVEDRVQA